MILASYPKASSPQMPSHLSSLTFFLSAHTSLVFLSLLGGYDIHGQLRVLKSSLFLALYPVMSLCIIYDVLKAEATLF